jgi:phage terminase small subunit
MMPENVYPDLTPKQKRFCEEYLIDLNATQAAIRAGYSKDTARSIGCENLTKPNVQELIARLQSMRATRTGITQDMVLEEYAKLAFASLGSFLKVESDGYARVDLSKMTPDQAAALTEVTVDQYDETGTEQPKTVKKIRIKMADKKAALDSLAKHLGMFEKDNLQRTPSIPQPEESESALVKDEREWRSAWKASGLGYDEYRLTNPNPTDIWVAETLEKARSQPPIDPDVTLANFKRRMQEGEVDPTSALTQFFLEHMEEECAKHKAKRG